MKKKVILILAIIVVIIIGIIVFFIVNNGKESPNEETGTTNSYSIEYNGVDVTPGKPFDENAISEEYSFYEIESCAFEGTDKVYTYSGVEIIVAEVDGVDTVYSVYFLDTETQTAEGVKVSDTRDAMINAYGEDYENLIENSYVYTKGDVMLSFIVENDTITSIEYTLNINN